MKILSQTDGIVWLYDILVNFRFQVYCFKLKEWDTISVFFLLHAVFVPDMKDLNLNHI